MCLSDPGLTYSRLHFMVCVQPYLTANTANIPFLAHSLGLFRRAFVLAQLNGPILSSEV